MLIIVISIFLELLSSIRQGRKIKEYRSQSRQRWPERWSRSVQESEEHETQKAADAGRGKRHGWISFKRTKKDEERQEAIRWWNGQGGAGLAEHTAWEEVFPFLL